MRRRLFHDRAAETDLTGIWLYSFENWGERQADRYLNAIEGAIEELARKPDGGTQRESLRRGYWSIRVEHHVVFYTVTDEEVRVRRVLHEAMDPGRHFHQ